MGEDGISVVFSGKVEFEGEANVGKECTIKLGKKSYTGEILAIGKWNKIFTLLWNTVVVFYKYTYGVVGTKEEMKRAEEEETLDEDPTQEAALPPPSKQSKFFICMYGWYVCD